MKKKTELFIHINIFIVCEKPMYEMHQRLNTVTNIGFHKRKYHFYDQNVIPSKVRSIAYLPNQRFPISQHGSNRYIFLFRLQNDNRNLILENPSGSPKSNEDNKLFPSATLSLWVFDSAHLAYAGGAFQSRGH